MINKYTKLTQLALFLISSCAVGGSTGFAQVKMTKDGDVSVIIEMTVSPAAEPTPVFKHRLTWLPLETIAGNAASGYLQSLVGNNLISKWNQAETALGDDLDRWRDNKPIPLDKLREASECFDEYVKQYIEQASVRRDCDWGFGLEEREGNDLYTVPISGLQDTRSISRALSLQADLAILESRYDDAVHLMKMNYQLAEHVGQVKSLVPSLICFAEVGITNGNMVNLIAAPDSPNMYWSLTELPRPFSNLREAFRLECNCNTHVFPVLKDVESKTYSLEQWARKIDSVFESIQAVMGERHFTPQTQKFLPAAIGVLAYGPAKKRLIAQGFDQAKVDAMPVGQVLLLAADREYQRIAQEAEKEIYLPFSIASKRLEELDDKLNKEFLDGLGKILAQIFLPAHQAVRGAEARIRRDIDALRLIEALRMHAAKHGKLPTSLDEISVVPVPLNPATDKPFEYRLEGATAIIELPRSDGITYSKRYRITLR